MTLLDEMLRYGFKPKSIIQDGQYHRFDIAKPGDKCGYYALDADERGVFGNWKTGEQYKYRPNDVSQMTDAERKAALAKYKEQRIKAKIEKRQEQQTAAIKARQQWDSFEPCPADNWYLTKKGIKPHHARVFQNNPIIPIYDGDTLVNFQRIMPDKKRYLFGAQKQYCYSTIEAAKDVIFIAEGFATAASISEATGQTCVIALDAGNLTNVARAMRKKYGVTQRIIIGADNDQSGVGVDAAAAAASEIFATYQHPKDVNDWNDFAQAYGLAALRDELLPTTLPTTISTELSTEPLEMTLDDNGRPKGTIENLKLLVESKGVVLRYNVIKKQEEILLPNDTFSMDNAGNASYSRILSFCKDEGMSTGHVKDYLTYLCDKNQFNPVATWITSKPWDGVSRLDAFYETITCANKKLRDIILMRWMLSAVASVFLPYGVSAHGVLVFQGAQNLGKTSWFKSLVPQELDVSKDGFILRIDDKDSLFQCVSNWMVELGELEATFKKSDIAQLKAFITSDRDILRRPYAAKDSVYPRRTVFFASVNHKEFLFDETGNRRFWSIETTKIDYNHGLDMQQIWAEFYALYLDGEKWVMAPDEIEMINTNNEDFMGADYHDELVAQVFAWDEYGLFSDDWKTVTEICKMVDIKSPKQTDLNKLSKAVKKYNGNQTKRGTGGARLLLVPRNRV